MVYRKNNLCYIQTARHVQLIKQNEKEEPL